MVAAVVVPALALLLVLAALADLALRFDLAVVASAGGSADDDDDDDDDDGLPPPLVCVAPISVRNRLGE